MSSYLSLKDYPAAHVLAMQLETYANRLCNESMRAVFCFNPSPERHIMEDNRLFILPVRWQGKPVTTAEAGEYAEWWHGRVSPQEMLAAAPLLARLTDHPLVVSAMYSLSMPGCEISPHIDNESSIGKVYRLHLGLLCPPGDCTLTVDGETRRWEEGKAFMFDSARVEHSARNNTLKPRMIAIIDLDREQLEKRPA